MPTPPIGINGYGFTVEMEGDYYFEVNGVVPSNATSWYIGTGDEVATQSYGYWRVSIVSNGVYSQIHLECEGGSCTVVQ